MDGQPSPNGSNGRDGRGRFAVGNRGGPGNPNARRAAQLRSAVMKAVTPKALRDVIAAVLKNAKAGDTTAAQLILKWTLGEPTPVDVLERLAELESMLENMNA